MSQTNAKLTLDRFGWLRRLLVPLLVYYAVTLLVPMLNGAYRQGSGFVEHAGFVLVIPLLLILPLVLLQILRPDNSSRVTSQ